MGERYYVQADWDAEAEVWVSSSDIPGLSVEAETIDEFVELVEALAPEMLADFKGRAHVQIRASRTLHLTVA